MVTSRWVVLIVALVSAQRAWAGAADDIKSLLEQGKADEAYQRGRGQPERLGDPAFDFFYGVAAINAGHAGEGVLALERYLLNYPENRAARLELARGYFVLGEDARARDEFQTTLAAGVSASEKVTIESYIDAIRARESRYLPSATSYVELGVGFDSNINAGAKSNDLGVLGVIDTRSTALHASDTYTALTAGVQGNYPLAPGLALFGGLSFDARQHHKASHDIFDLGSVAGLGGVSYLKDRDLLRAYVGHNLIDVDNQLFLTNTNLNGEWQHQVDDANRYSLGLQYAWLRYRDTHAVVLMGTAPVLSLNTARNADFAVINAGWHHSFAHRLQPTLALGVSYGEERNDGQRAGVSNDELTRRKLSRDVYGLRAMLSLVPGPQWGASAGYFYQQSDYQASFGVGIDAPRKDRYQGIDASLSYFYSKNVSLRGELMFVDQHSNVPIYTYDRSVFAAKLRYDFD